MELDEIPDVHSPDFPNSGVLKWVPDGPTVLARMDRSTVKTYTSFLAYTKTFGHYVDRLGLPCGKYFWQLPENGRPFSLEERALDILAVNDPYYEYRILTLPTGFSIRTGINISQFSMPGGATQLQVFDENNRAIPVSKLLGEGILKGKDKPIGLPK